MLDVKQLLIKMLSFKTKETTSGSFNVSANGAVDLTINVSQAGYVPMGIVGLEFGGSGSSYLTPYRFIISGNNAMVSVRNHTSTARNNQTVKVTVLYRGG